MLTLLTALTTAHAGSQLDKKAQNTYRTAVMAAYPDKVWALKDLPVKSGQASIAAYIAPIAEVTADGYKIEASNQITSHFGGAQSTWWGVRPYDTLTFKEIKFDDDFAVITFNGGWDSAGRDTKIKVFGSDFAKVKPVLDELLTTTDPVDASWPADIQAGIRNRAVVNGMSKRQAYLVVGEPTNAQVTEQDGKKIETWTPRPNDGMRIGYGATIKPSGFPNTLRFEDGKLVGVATSSSGGVNLDD